MEKNCIYKYIIRNTSPVLDGYELRLDIGIHNVRYVGLINKSAKYTYLNKEKYIFGFNFFT